MLPPSMARCSDVVYFNAISLSGASGEVVEHVLLAGQVAGFVPFLAVFSAAPNIGQRVDPTLFQPDPGRRAESGCDTEAVTAVAVKQCRVGSIEFHSLFSENAHRNLGAVLGGCEFPHDFQSLKSAGEVLDKAVRVSFLAPFS